MPIIGILELDHLVQLLHFVDEGGDRDSGCPQVLSQLVKETQDLRSQVQCPLCYNCLAPVHGLMHTSNHVAPLTLKVKEKVTSTDDNENSSTSAQVPTTPFKVTLTLYKVYSLVGRSQDWHTQFHLKHGNGLMCVPHPCRPDPRTVE